MFTFIQIKMGFSQGIRMSDFYLIHCVFKFFSPGFMCILRERKTTKLLHLCVSYFRGSQKHRLKNKSTCCKIIYCRKQLS